MIQGGLTKIELSLGMNGKCDFVVIWENTISKKLEFIKQLQLPRYSSLRVFGAFSYTQI